VLFSIGQTVIGFVEANWIYVVSSGGQRRGNIINFVENLGFFGSI
jgi:hypothetical protein